MPGVIESAAHPWSALKLEFLDGCNDPDEQPVVHFARRAPPLAVTAQQPCAAQRARHGHWHKCTRKQGRGSTNSPACSPRTHAITPTQTRPHGQARSGRTSPPRPAETQATSPCTQSFTPRAEILSPPPQNVGQVYLIVRGTTVTLGPSWHSKKLGKLHAGDRVLVYHERHDTSSDGVRWLRFANGQRRSTAPRSARPQFGWICDVEQSTGARVCVSFKGEEHAAAAVRDAQAGQLPRSPLPTNRRWKAMCCAARRAATHN